MNGLFRAALGFILVSGLLFASAGSEKPVRDQISDIENGLLPVNIFEGEPPYPLRERMKFYKVPGLIVTVIKDFKILWTKTYGIADRELQTPETERTLSNIGSLSKGVAALTRLSLIQQGKFNLDDDVNQLMGQKKLTAAMCIFKLNTEFYPVSANVHDSLGEAPAKSGDIKGAIRQYEKALELNPKMRNA